MYRALALACCAAACVSGAPPSDNWGDADSKTRAWPKAGPPGPEPDLAQARFFARIPGSDSRHELKLEDFAAEVKTGAQTTQSHLWITVANPGDAQVEAFMRLPIPPGAAVTRAVLHVGKESVEGAFVGRDRARAIYRSITERRRDPALITWSGPDWIEASIFPVEKKDRRILELEWIEPTATRDGAAWYRVPVIAQEGGKAQRARTVVDGVAVETRNRAWIALATLGALAAPAAARAPGEPFGYAFAPAQSVHSGAPRLVIVAETSAQMSPVHRQRQHAFIDRLADALPDGAGVTLLGVDWAVAAVAENASPAEVKGVLDHLDGIASAGALDLERALLVASTRARAIGARTIVFVGPGVDTFHGDGLAEPLRQMQEAGQSLVVVGGEAAPMADAAALTGGESFPWSSPVEAVSRVLAVSERTGAGLTVPNAERFFPLETVTGETRWLARFVGPLPEGLSRVDARDLEALWVRAHVAGTSGRDTEQGVRHRVLTPLASILVLESMADYGRWGIAAPDRPDARTVLHKGEEPRNVRNAGILGITKAPAEGGFDSHLARQGKRGSDATEAVLGRLIGDDVGEAYGVGGLGLVGTGAGGGGTGEGTVGLGNFGTIGKGGGGGLGSGYGRTEGLTGRRARAPELASEQATVRGSLDADVIRRTIRRHANEAKYCHDQGLVRRPGLAGRVVVQFTVGSAGQVLASVVQSSTLNDVRVETCIAQAVQRWEFPKPLGGGIAIVSYPFNLVPGRAPALASISGAHASAPVPPNPWETALAALHAKEDLSARLSKVAAAIGAPATDSLSVLAWWIVERHLRSGQPIAGACILAANFLRDAIQPHEAARILSEAGGSDLPAATAEFRRWGNDADVKRLGELAARK